MHVILTAVTTVRACTGEGTESLVTSLGVLVRSVVGKQKQRETHRILNINLTKERRFFRLYKVVRYSSQDHLLGPVIKLRTGRSNNSVPFTGEQARSTRNWRVLCCPRCSFMFSAEAFEMRKSLLTLSLLNTGLKNYEPFIYGDTHYITLHHITSHHNTLHYINYITLHYITNSSYIC